MGFEQNINQFLNRIPVVKKVVKRLYQLGMYAVSKKVKSEGNIIRVSPDDSNHEYFFGYYDKSPWDATDRYMLCMKAKDTWSDVSPKEVAEILLIDTELADNDPNRIRVLATTRAWNVQQSCMLQWLGSDYKSRILFNDFRNGKYCSVILNIETMEEKIIAAPVYSVAADGSFALTLDFSRLYNLRPGYGYYNEKEITEGVALPDTTAIWKVDLHTGEVVPVLKYTDFAKFEPRPEMLVKGSVHKVNHIMLSPNGKRFMVLYRWFNGQRKYTRLITCNVDGTDMYVLSDDDMVSHCYWKNDNEILAFENKKQGGPGYYLMKDRTQEFTHCWPQFSNDGHPSYSPDKSIIVTDSYPDRARIASINIMDGDETKIENKTIARVFAPFKYDNDTRCDLHPRWNHAGDKICFDAVFEGHRGLYVVETGEKSCYTQSDMTDETIEEKNSNQGALLSVIVPVYNVEKYLERCVESIVNQTYSNLEIILVDDGSPDNSGKLCDRFAQEDGRIIVIHKQNGGLSSARNAGLEVATGKYVAFVDSDDWIDRQIYQKCIEIINKYSCDVVDFKPVFAYDSNCDVQNTITSTAVVEGESILYDYLYLGQTEQCPFSVCRKVYKQSLFENMRFPVGMVNEDIATNFKVLEKAKKLVHISDVGYYYFQNSESITTGQLKKKDFDLLTVSKELIELSKPYNNKAMTQLANIKLARSYFSLLAKAATGGISEDIIDKKGTIQYLTDCLRKNYILLMKSPMPLNRKILITLMCVHYMCVEVPVRIYLKLRK